MFSIRYIGGENHLSTGGSTLLRWVWLKRSPIDPPASHRSAAPSLQFSPRASPASWPSGYWKWFGITIEKGDLNWQTDMLDVVGSYFVHILTYQHFRLQRNTIASTARWSASSARTNSPCDLPRGPSWSTPQCCHSRGQASRPQKGMDQSSTYLAVFGWSKPHLWWNTSHSWRLSTWAVLESLWGSSHFGG